jgi:hypothetical protein
MIKQGRTAEAVISTMFEKTDNMIKHGPFLAVEVAPKGEVVKKNIILITTL